MTFVRGVCLAALLWIAWVATALYFSAQRALPSAPPIHLAAAPSEWCDYRPGPPLVTEPQNNYDVRNGRRIGSTT